MTDFASLLVADRGQKARPDPSRRQGRASPPGSRSGPPRTAPCSRRSGSTARRHSPSSSCRAAATSRWSARSRTRRRCRPGASPSSAESLPEGTYKLAAGEPGTAALGWLLAQHRFDAYRSKKDEPERGPARAGHRRSRRGSTTTVRLAEATALVRDLVNTPAADLGPAELEQAVRDDAKRSRRAGARHERRRARQGLSADRRGRRRGDRRSARRA